MTDDMDLLREYAQNNSEEAFAELVSRYINLVYSVGLRQINDPQLAEEITQVTFIILARKADSLSPQTVLSGWLCRTARNVSAKALKMQQRRQIREHEAFMQSALNEPEPESIAWSQIAPLLDTALAQLGGRDHDAIVLRFFDRKSFKEVGAALGTTEESARKRVHRTLEKLQRLFKNRGIVVSSALIGGAISTNSIQSAPVALAKSVTLVAIAKGAAASGTTLTLIKGTLKFMAWTKAKMAIVAVVIVLVGTGTATFAYHQIHEPVYQGRRISEYLMDYRSTNRVIKTRGHLAIRDLGEAGLPFLLRTAKSTTGDQKNRAAALSAIGVLGKKARPYLQLEIDAASNPNPDLRAGAMSALGKIPADPEKMVPLFIHGLGDPDSRIRGLAAIDLAPIGAGAAKAIPALLAACRDRSLYVRQSATNTLELLGVTPPPPPTHTSDIPPPPP